MPRDMKALHSIQRAAAKRRIISWQVPLQTEAKGPSVAVKMAIRNRPAAPEIPIQADRPTALATRETTKAKPARPIA